MSRSQAALAALVFGAGIGSLATEIAASRLLDRPRENAPGERFQSTLWEHAFRARL